MRTSPLIILVLFVFFSGFKHPAEVKDEPGREISQPDLTIDFSLLRTKIPLTGYSPPEIPMADDAIFLEALDLERPGLEGVKKALESGNVAGAVQKLAAYFRGRQKPVFVSEGRTIAPADPQKSGTARLVADSMAEQAMSRRYQIAGITYQFDDEIDWELNPTTQPGYQGAWSSQFHTQLNRMHYWRELAEAWRTTGNPEYRAELIEQVQDWQSKNRPPKLEEVPKFIQRYKAGGGNVREFRLWLPLDVGQRAANTTRVFETLRTDPAMDDRTLVETVKMLGEHARILSQLDIDGNHLAIATMGLATVAVMFPEFKESEAWLREAVARVGVEMSKQVYPDGAQMELTPWYHFTALRNFASVLEIAAANGYEIPQELHEGLRRMYDYIVRIVDPLGAAPPLNDSEWLSESVLRQALIFFPEDPVFQWFAGGRKGGTPPEILSLTVPFAGQAVMRSGWDKDARYLLMEYGPFGTGHMHEDKLGLSVAAYGRRLLVDPGRNKYEASVMRDFSINAGAHTTVLFDGLFQARRLAEKKLAAVAEPVSVIWHSDALADYVVGSYGVDELEVFALPTAPPGHVAPEWFQLVTEERLREDDVQMTKRMVQHRHVLFVKPDYWVVVDTFDPLDVAPHDYTSLFQMGAGETGISGTTVSLGKPGEAGMALAFSTAKGTGELEVVRGQREPFLMGWTFADGEPSPSPTAIFRFRSEGPTAAAYAIVPHPPGAQPVVPRIEWLPSSDEAYKIRVEPGNNLPGVALSIPFDGGKGTWEIHSAAQ